jgi:UDP-perosamine 4-acetyltransferase
MKNIIVIGSGGHAKVVIDIIHRMKDCRILGITSDSLKKDLFFCGYPVLGGDDSLKSFVKEKNFFVAMGLGGFKDNLLRTRVFNYIKILGMNFINVIHYSAIISDTVQLGEGVTIFPGVVINTDVKIGNNVIVATASSIDHETVIEDNVLISAGVIVGAYATIKSGALLALGSKVVSGVTIGSNSLVAAGAVVVNNIESNEKVFGIPAKAKL